MNHANISEERLILWDLDGTLVDSRKDLVRATNVAVQTLGYQAVSDDHFARMVGNGVRYLVNRALPEHVPDAEREKAIGIFLDYYRDHIADETHFFPGVQDILEDIPVLHIILSNKREDLCRELINRLGAVHLFREIVGGDTFKQRKPDPAPVIGMIEKFGVRKDRTVLVGDSIIDMEAGRRAGVLTIGVTWGFGDPVENPRFAPDWVFQDVRGLFSFLQEWSGFPSAEKASGRGNLRG